jgi:hypothetical protein
MGGFGSGRRSSGAPTCEGGGACIVGCAELALSQTLPGVLKDCSARNSGAHGISVRSGANRRSAVIPECPKTEAIMKSFVSVVGDGLLPAPPMPDTQFRSDKGIKRLIAEEVPSWLQSGATERIATKGELADIRREVRGVMLVRAMALIPWRLPLVEGLRRQAASGIRVLIVVRNNGLVA